MSKNADCRSISVTNPPPFKAETPLDLHWVTVGLRFLTRCPAVKVPMAPPYMRLYIEIHRYKWTASH